MSTTNPDPETTHDPPQSHRRGWRNCRPAVRGALAGVALLAITAGTGLVTHHSIDRHVTAGSRSIAVPAVTETMTHVIRLRPVPEAVPGTLTTYAGTLGGLGAGRHSLAQVVTRGVWSPSAACNAALRSDPRAGHDSYDGYTIDADSVVIRPSAPTSGPEWVSAEHIGENATVTGSGDIRLWTQAYTVSTTSGTPLDAACAGAEVDIEVAVLVKTRQHE